MNIYSTKTIYVGNIQSIDDDTLREYFQRFGEIEAFYHNCSRAADEWLIDYRFIRFSPETDINVFLTNKVDHTICRIRLDIHSYEAAYNDETRLILDRKICIAHTNPKLDRNIIKKSFTRHGRILNCTCVSSGNGVEYVYIEFDSINTVRSIFSSGQTHFAGRTSLAVKQPLRPSQGGVKLEASIPMNVNDGYQKNSMKPVKYSYQEPSNSTRYLPPTSCYEHPQNQSSAESTNTRQLNNHADNKNTTVTPSQQQLKDLENEYNVIILQDFDEITYQIDKYLHKQRKSYTKIRQSILNELQLPSTSSR